MASASEGATFDYCVITASSPAQANLYESLVQRRIKCGMYPQSLSFRFYADPEGGRVGSGGGTLVALSRLLQQETGQSAFADGALDEGRVKDFFASKRVLVLHAGGESRRLPCYVPEGKLFGPISIPSDRTSACPPVVLDLVLALYSKYPWSMGEVIMASGDVIVDFDVEKFRTGPFERGAICGFGKAASLEQGSRHGVFAFTASDASDMLTLGVSDFHQKSPVPVLQKECLVPGTTDKCALDMGIFSMSPEWCLQFFRFASSFTEEGSTVMDAVEASKLFFDFYLEVVIASLPEQSESAYLERMRAASKLPASVLKLMYDSLKGLELRGALVADAAFLHFGTLREFPQASLECRQHAMIPFRASASPNSELLFNGFADKAGEILLLNCCPRSVQVIRGVAEPESTLPPAQRVWVEMCEDIAVTASAGGFHMIVGLKGVVLPGALPAGICLDARHIDGHGQIVAVYSAEDSFKKEKTPEGVIFCGVPLCRWLAVRGLTAANIWEDESSACELWLAKLFCVYTAADFLEGYWKEESFSKEQFLKAERFSLSQLNALDSAVARDERRALLFRKCAPAPAWQCYIM